MIKRPMADISISPPIIVHVFGPSCCGKTRLLRDIPEAAKWDIAIYNKGGSVHRDSIFISSELKRFLHGAMDAGKQIIFIESSGTNKAINAFLHRMSRPHHVIHIGLFAPDDATLKARCEAREIDYENTRVYNRAIVRLLRRCAPAFPVAYDEAQSLVEDVLGGL